jgi:hypothetical protein
MIPLECAHNLSIYLGCHTINDLRCRFLMHDISISLVNVKMRCRNTMKMEVNLVHSTHYEKSGKEILGELRVVQGEMPVACR